MYQNEIREMSETALYVLAAEHNVVTKHNDTDEIIELLEQEIGTIFECAEDDILDSIMNGNWSQAVEQMQEHYITPHGLIDYINDYRFEQYDEAYEFFDLDSAVSITELYYQEKYRKEVS